MAKKNYGYADMFTVANPNNKPDMPIYRVVFEFKGQELVIPIWQKKRKDGQLVFDRGGQPIFAGPIQDDDYIGQSDQNQGQGYQPDNQTQGQYQPPQQQYNQQPEAGDIPFV